MMMEYRPVVGLFPIARGDSQPVVRAQHINRWLHRLISTGKYQNKTLGRGIYLAVVPAQAASI